jgi:hypothetical protein
MNRKKPAMPEASHTKATNQLTLSVPEGHQRLAGGRGSFATEYPRSRQESRESKPRTWPGEMGHSSVPP